MILEHPVVPADRIRAVVRREWAVRVDAVEHLSVGSCAWHWRVGQDGGPQWFATLESLVTQDEQRTRVAAYDATARLGRRLSFVVAPVHTQAEQVAVEVAPGLLLTLMPYLEGAPVGTGPFRDDADRALVASMVGDLHRLHRRHRPAALPVWRPRIGRRGLDQSADLERCLQLDHWSGGPWSVPAGRLLGDARSVLRASLRRFRLLAAAVTGTVDRWVVSHGEAHTANLVRTPDGHRLVDWGRLALAPRERDLRLLLGEADGDEPWYAYFEAGGGPEPLSPGAVELFALERHLGLVTEYALRLSRPHEDTPDDRRCFDLLEGELAALVDRHP